MHCFLAFARANLAASTINNCIPLARLSSSKERHMTQNDPGNDCPLGEVTICRGSRRWQGLPLPR
jgi:hypothetical protein